MSIRQIPHDKNEKVSKFACYWTLFKRDAEEPSYADVLVLAMQTVDEDKRKKDQWAKYIEIQHATTWFSPKNSRYLAVSCSTVHFDTCIFLVSKYFYIFFHQISFQNSFIALSLIYHIQAPNLPPTHAFVRFCD